MILSWKRSIPFQYLGSRGAQRGFTPQVGTIYTVSILGLARSPTAACAFIHPCSMFQYLGSRGAQHASRLYLLSPILFQYLGSRGAQLSRGLPDGWHDTCFNTWAREEPNRVTVRFPSDPIPSFQYLGSRGAQRNGTVIDSHVGLFQYLGSRGAQLYSVTVSNRIESFNTWAREEPNAFLTSPVSASYCFNTWAREEPNSFPEPDGYQAPVSILGLARSPTIHLLLPAERFFVSILGLARSPT